MAVDPDVRGAVLGAVKNNIISKDALIIAMLEYMREVEIKDMLHVNEIYLDTGHKNVDIDSEP